MRGNCDWPDRSALSKIRASFREGVGGGLKSVLLSGRGQEGAGGGRPPWFGLPPLRYAENSILHVNQFKIYDDTINDKW